MKRLDYCAFSKDHKCIKWIDYQILLQEIEEAESLCQGNWIEIEKQYNYILELQAILVAKHLKKVFDKYKKSIENALNICITSL